MVNYWAHTFYLQKFVYICNSMTDTYNKLHELVARMHPITLEEMKSVRLMKRTDTKFVTNLAKLEELLELTVGTYSAQHNNGKCIAGYRTVYWDTPVTHEMFRQHHCGHFPRTKVRARTYLDSGHSFLEVKKKDNHGKTRKKRIEVPTIEAVINERYGEEFLTERTGYQCHRPRTNRILVPSTEYLCAPAPPETSARCWGLPRLQPRSPGRRGSFHGGQTCRWRFEGKAAHRSGGRSVCPCQ